MRIMVPKLILTFDPGEGVPVVRMCIDLDQHTARQFQSITPPIQHGVPWLSGTAVLESFEEVVEIMKVREFRKDFFIRECRRLGALLAERMEDAEGWHDTSRIEPAILELATAPRNLAMTKALDK